MSKNPILWQNDLPDHMRTDRIDDVWNGIGKVVGKASSWSDEDRENFIDLVSKNPILWQNDLPDHMRMDKNDDVWNGIGKVMGKGSGNVSGNILEQSEKRSSARTS